MNVPDSQDTFLDNRIREGASETVPPLEVERRLQGQLAAFRDRLEGSEWTVAFRDPRWGWPTWRRLGIVGMAAVAVAVVGLIIVRPRSGFAEVVDAVLKQPWVHTRTTFGSDRRVWEDWVSPINDIVASKDPDSIRYEDYRLKVYDSYDPAEEVVYRGPVAGKSRAGQFDSMAGALKVLLQGGRPPENLGFLGVGGESTKLLDQHVEKVTEEGHAWLDYRLTVKGPESPQPMTMVFRIDAASLLPQSCRTEWVLDGKPSTRETQFDYPEKGPADIYALGVPKDSKLVDRIPSGDLKRIIETLRVGRERMDNYRAVFVQRFEGIDHHWWKERPQIFYRKGNKSRGDRSSNAPGDEATLKRPAEGANLDRWWFERAKLFRFVPAYIQCGSTEYSCDVKSVTDPDGSEHPEIVSVNKTDYNTSPGEIYPARYSMRPEFACRPPLGIGNPHQEPRLDLHPAEGPPGCILLSIRHTSTKDRINEKGVGLADGRYYWLDPKRDYIVMRSDTIVRDGGGQANVHERDTVEEEARSPQGIWYAKKIRRSFPGRGGKDKMADQVYHLYVDFDAEIPDSLFDIPEPGRIP